MPVKEVVTTNHGAKRLKERVGIKRKAAEKFLLNVLTNGKTREQTKGKLKRHLRDRAQQYCDIPRQNLVVFGKHIYIFTGFTKPKLITVLHLPKDMEAGA